MLNLGIISSKKTAKSTVKIIISKVERFVVRRFQKSCSIKKSERIKGIARKSSK